VRSSLLLHLLLTYLPSGQHDAELLRKEATYLEAQHDYLVSRAKSSRPQRVSIKTKRRGRENAVVVESKQQLVKSNKDNTILTELVSQQKTYMDNFKAMLAFAPVNDVVYFWQSC
jgi:outer membrane lipopolysaccharide assembly protein LptE/RlpB